ncbi:MAG: methionyl-tRNA formyltransferase [Micrococcales bacterium]|nr:methionyl-tRNA formyltransferase [Micrococcales bacterium]
MRVVFAGTPAVALPSLDAIASSGHELVGVITRPAAPAGRGRRLEPSPVAVRAQEFGVPILTPSSMHEPDILAALEELAPDACPVVAYGNLVSPEALTIPRHGWVNLHFSLLPAWRGAAPVQHAIMAGDEVTGATTFRLERRLDTGPVYGVMTETIRPSDTAGELLDRLAQAGAGLLVATLDGIESGELIAKPQPADGVSLAPRIEVEDARIDWTRPAMAIDRLVRGCTPAPGAWTTFRGARLKIAPLVPSGSDRVPEHGRPSAGTLLVTKRDVFVGTGTLPVQLSAVQGSGKKPMPAPDWARGMRTESGERVGDE